LCVGTPAGNHYGSPARLRSTPDRSFDGIFRLLRGPVAEPELLEQVVLRFRASLFLWADKFTDPTSRTLVQARGCCVAVDLAAVRQRPLLLEPLVRLVRGATAVTAANDKAAVTKNLLANCVVMMLLLSVNGCSGVAISS
jgi:hypothetical protein